MSSVFCIRVTGGVLNSELQNSLFQAAEHILIKKKNRASVKGSFFEGSVSTTWNTVRIAALYGTKFEATIDLTKGRLNVVYLIRSEHDHAFGKPPKNASAN